MRTLYKEVGIDGGPNKELKWVVPVKFPITASEGIRALDDARDEYSKMRRIDRISKSLVTLATLAFIAAFYLHPLSIVPVLLLLGAGISGWAYIARPFSASTRVEEARAHLRAMEYANENTIQEMM